MLRLQKVSLIGMSAVNLLRPVVARGLAAYLLVALAQPERS
jgi:K+-transporting ATPase KdpF subunit